MYFVFYTQNPQTGCVDKKMNIFSSGSTSVKSTVDKMGYMKGQLMSLQNQTPWISQGKSQLYEVVNPVVLYSYFFKGEVIKVSSDVNNSSSRDLKLKYSLEQKQSYFAQGHSKRSCRNIFKIVGDPIPSGVRQTVNTDLTLPDNLDMSITNCNIMKVDYVFKVIMSCSYFFIQPASLPSNFKKKHLNFWASLSTIGFRK